MEQPDLFTGDELRDFGIAAAERDRILAIQAVDKAIEFAAWPGGPFTAEQVRDHLGRYTRDLEDISKVIGGRMRAAALRGEIFTLGETVRARRASAHSRRMLLWYGKGAA
jgi:antitoxin component HigA of HigAB toxin-antitoxin module